jgi:TonB family protein
VRRSTLLFFFILVVIVAMIARCNSRSRLAEERDQPLSASPLVPSAAPSPVTTPTVTPAPTAQAAKSPEGDVMKATAQVQPAVVSISVFEPSGKLLRTGTGVFVSSRGKLLTTRSLMEGSAHAVAKTANNQIHNIGGILTDMQSEDLAVLDTEIKDEVPFITPTTNAIADEGNRIAVAQSPLGRTKASVLEGTILKKHKDGNGEWLELSIPLANDAIGAPVVNSRGEIVGLVTRGPGDPAVVVRTSATLDAILARTPNDGKGKFLTEETPPSPAEGPLRKMPLAQNPQGQRSKLIYSPAPAYPASARGPAGMLRGTGRFRLSFDANGQVKNIVILRSTQNGALDQAAVQALRRWKAAPGEEWSLNVPITFQ